MKHNTKTLEINLTPAINDYLEKKIAHLDKFLSGKDEAAMCYIDLGKTTQHHKNGDFFKTELTVHIGGKSFRASAIESDLYASIDIATEEMAEELKSFKDKKTTLLKRGGQKIKGFIKKFYNDEE
jgi:putative sigma-54 modulation protein